MDAASGLFGLTSMDGVVEVLPGSYPTALSPCAGWPTSYCVPSNVTVLAASGAELDGGGGFGSAFGIAMGATNITLDGFTVTNYANETGGGDVGNGVISWDTGASNVTIRGFTMSNLGWNGVLVGSDDGSTQSGWLVEAASCAKTPGKS